MLSFIGRYDYHLLTTNISSGSIYFCGCFEYRWWNCTTTQGIFHYFQNDGLYGDQGGSQTLIIIAMTVMTGKLSIKYMVVFTHMLDGQVSFMMRICNQSMQEQVLQSNSHIIIFKIEYIVVICLFLAIVHLSGCSIMLMLVVYSHVVVMYIVRLIMVNTRMLNL